MVPAFGVLGGLSGVPVGAWIDRHGAIEDFDTPGKVAGHPLEEGSIVMIRSAGGGGYGDPLERDAERVALDVREGYVSAKAAREQYGLVLDMAGRVDAAATAALRKRLRAARIALVTRLDADVFEKGAVSRRRICRLNPADASAAGVGEDDVVELDSRRAAPLRAWTRLDAGVSPGTVNKHNCRLPPAGMSHRGLGGDAGSREDAHGTCGRRGRGKERAQRRAPQKLDESSGSHFESPVSVEGGVQPAAYRSDVHREVQ